MLKTKRHIPARHTIAGHYNMQYPDTEREGFIIPPETPVEPLHWIASDGAKAYLFHTPTGKVVAWIKNTEEIVD
jgi:hypothetical protein